MSSTPAAGPIPIQAPIASSSTPSSSAAPVGRAISITRSSRRPSSSSPQPPSTMQSGASFGAGGSGGASVGRRSSRATHPPMAPLPPPKPLSHAEAIEALRNFLRERSSYDVFPVSFRLLVLDTKLKVKKALDVMLLYGVVSAPLWNTETATFAGMFTVQDVIHLIQYYYATSNWEASTADVEGFRLESIRDIEKNLKVPPPPLLNVHPLRPLYDACRFLIRTHAHRLPLVDRDTQTGGETVISVLTQYRVLKFIAVNCKDITQYLTASVQELGIGTYVGERREGQTTQESFGPVATATLQTTVFDVVHMFSERGISAVPIVDDEGKVVNLYETVDVITLVRNGAYTALDLTIAQALKQRPVDFPGVVTCSPKDSLGAVFSLIKIRRVHRLVVVAGQDDPQPGRLVGIISLSDIMQTIIDEGLPLGGSGQGAEPLDRALQDEAEATSEKLASPASV